MAPWQRTLWPLRNFKRSGRMGQSRSQSQLFRNISHFPSTPFAALRTVIPVPEGQPPEGAWS
jgi:hypothetical protein